MRVILYGVTKVNAVVVEKVSVESRTVLVNQSCEGEASPICVLS